VQSFRTQDQDDDNGDGDGDDMMMMVMIMMMMVMVTIVLTNWRETQSDSYQASLRRQYIDPQKKWD